MSVKAISWVWDNSPYEVGALLVHLALADVANDDHNNELWMNQDKIAGKARLSVRQVRRILDTMVSEGFLELLEQGGGRGRTTRYRMVMETGQIVPVSNKTGHREQENRTSGAITPITNSKNSNAPETRVKPSDDPMLGFDFFWKTYPKRNGRLIGKSLCQKRWLSMSLEDRRGAYRGARNYAEDVDAGKTIAKDPDRWLRDRLWEDWQTQEQTYERNEWEA